MPTVYILHFDGVVAGHRHYVGCTSDLERRLEQHRTGDGGALLTKAAKNLGVSFKIGFTRRANFDLEQRIKTCRHVERWCNICKAADAYLSRRMAR